MASSVPPPSSSVLKSHAPTGSMVGLAFGALGVVFGDIGTSPLYTLQVGIATAAGGASPTRADVLGVCSLIVWALTLVVTVKYLDVRHARGQPRRGRHPGAPGARCPRRRCDGGRHRRRSRCWSSPAPRCSTATGSSRRPSACSARSRGVELAAPGLQARRRPAHVRRAARALRHPAARHRRPRQGLRAGHGRSGSSDHRRARRLAHRRRTRTSSRRCARSGARSTSRITACAACPSSASSSSPSPAARRSTPTWATSARAPSASRGSPWSSRRSSSATSGRARSSCATPPRSRTRSSPWSRRAPRRTRSSRSSTAATIIASQALITGVFSLTHQAVQLGYFPRVTVTHTSRDAEGQIYVPEMNWALCIACIGLVLGFRESARLAAAYGIAVSGTMGITSFVYFVVTRRTWKWPLWKSLPPLLLFLSFDLPFFAANLTKFLDGGWIPIAGRRGHVRRDGRLAGGTQRPGRAHRRGLAAAHRLPRRPSTRRTSCASRAPPSSCRRTPRARRRCSSTQARRVRALREHLVLAHGEHRPRALRAGTRAASRCEDLGQGVYPRPSIRSGLHGEARRAAAASRRPSCPSTSTTRRTSSGARRSSSARAARWASSRRASSPSSRKNARSPTSWFSHPARPGHRGGDADRPVHAPRDTPRHAVASEAPCDKSGSRAPGPPRSSRSARRPTPSRPTGQVRIRVKAAGINFADLMARVGLYPDAPKIPCVVGYEVSGVVDQVGAGRHRAARGRPRLRRCRSSAATPTASSSPPTRSSRCPRR